MCQPTNRSRMRMLFSLLPRQALGRCPRHRLLLLCGGAGWRRGRRGRWRHMAHSLPRVLPTLPPAGNVPPPDFISASLPPGHV